MKTLMFYSYKGGSGRTVAAGNVSAALAKLGKRVAVIDLDFEAPGLHHVFGAENTAQYRYGSGIQHYLKGEINLEDLERHVYINMFGPSGPLNAYSIPKDAALWYILASPKVAKVDTTEPQVARRMRLLIEALRTNHDVELVIIDAASGIRDAYMIAADVSDEMLIFFRWSTQHVEGTLRMARYMKFLKDYGQTSTPFRLVAAATPSEQELAALDDDNHRMFVRLRDDTRAKIEATLQECQVMPATILHDIPEIVWLKWRETIMVFSQDHVSPYEELARKLIGA